jgi:hypothetical protein
MKMRLFANLVSTLLLSAARNFAGFFMPFERATTQGGRQPHAGWIPASVYERSGALKSVYLLAAVLKAFINHGETVFQIPQSTPQRTKQTNDNL